MKIDKLSPNSKKYPNISVAKISAYAGCNADIIKI
jgi:hypothetical protein